MKRKLRIVVDAGAKFCGECEHVSSFSPSGRPSTDMCSLFVVRIATGDDKPKRHTKCLEAEER